jgi:hypothetical protein
MPWGPSAEELRCIWLYQLSEQVGGGVLRGSHMSTCMLVPALFVIAILNTRCCESSFLQCMFELRGMVSVEFAHYKRRYGLMYHLEPTRSSTAFIPGGLTRQTACSVSLNST